MTEDKAPSVLQHQIRANASQLPDYMSDLYAWEKAIGKENLAHKRAKTFAAANETPPPRTARVIDINLSRENSTANGKTSDAHTYDKGYKRWERFDVDAALKEADEEGSCKQGNHEASGLVDTSSASSQVDVTSMKFTPVTTKSREELEKEEGNAHYKRGDYVSAIKSYTRCLSYNPHNAVVLSNRAMAYLKNREFANAEDDCTLALKADPTHVKSYSRRGTARNSMGKHRLALLDFHHAATLDPKSRQIQTQLQSTRELLRTAIKHSLKRTEFSIEVVEERLLTNHTNERDNAASENKENRGSQQLNKVFPGTEQKSSPRQESASSPLPQDAASLRETRIKKKTKSLTIMPKLPEKAPATSYEFGRVWKTLALRGDAEQKPYLLKLRAAYLLMIDPSTLRDVFKTAIEPDVLCEIFHVLRYAVLPVREINTSLPTGTASFVFAFISELMKVPRFNMTVMLLSDSEKQNVAWVVEYLQALVKESNEIEEHEVADLRKLYELP